MPASKEDNVEISDDIENDIEDEFDDTDYGFIIGADGELKSFVFPDLLMEDPPKQIQKILKIYGIKDINELTPRIVH